MYLFLVGIDPGGFRNLALNVYPANGCLRLCLFQAGRHYRREVDALQLGLAGACEMSGSVCLMGEWNSVSKKGESRESANH